MEIHSSIPGSSAQPDQVDFPEVHLDLGARLVLVAVVETSVAVTIAYVKFRGRRQVAQPATRMAASETNHDGGTDQ